MVDNYFRAQKSETRLAAQLYSIWQHCSRDSACLFHAAFHRLENRQKIGTMSHNDRVKNGRFVQNKLAKRNTKAVQCMSESKKKCVAEIVKESEVEDGVGDGIRLVQLKELGRNLKCFECTQVLNLENMIAERRIGLHSVLTVLCKSCDKSTIVHTGKMMENNVSHINMAVILGAVHAGTGNTALNKILACGNVPSISNDLYKRYEKMVGEAIEKEAKASCKRAAILERDLVIKNIEKLSDELPQEIVSDIYPHYIDLKASRLLENPADPEAPNVAFDSALGEIINVIVAFDTGWTKRGTGRSYDSLNSYSCIIGFLSGKILDYTTRNRKCRLCDLGHKTEDHDCRKNFVGSAKAMEASAGVQLINHSNVLKEVGLQPRVIIGDEDSSMISAVRKDNQNMTYHKIADKNHLTKNFGKELYKMAESHKQLNRKGVISHIKKCFSYAVSQNKCKSEQLAKNLKQIPDHLFNRHENCGPWCKPEKKHSVTLTDSALYEVLVNFFFKYALNAHKFSISGSSQANESWNNIIAHKNHKNVCLSLSSASDMRVGDSVCVKNDGESCILNYRGNLTLGHGKYTAEYAMRVDRKRTKRAERDVLQSSKLRRIQRKNERELLKKTNEKAEGVQYQSNWAFNEVMNHIDKSSEKISEASTNIVYFDLETTGFGCNADILQIAAQKDEEKFNVYIKSSKEISAQASETTGLHKINGNLYLRDKILETVEVTEALKLFQEYLDSLSENQTCLLVAHNANTFDMPRLLQTIMNNNMLQNFTVIAGFSDTYPVFKKLLPDRKNDFTLSSLTKDFLEPDDSGQFHDAVYDVAMLQKLTRTLKAESDLYKSSKTLYECNIKLVNNAKVKHNLQFLSELQNIVSPLILKRLAFNDISCDALLKMYKNEGEENIKKLLTEATENEKFRITKDKKILGKVIEFLKSSTQPIEKTVS